MGCSLLLLHLVDQLLLLLNCVLDTLNARVFSLDLVPKGEDSFLKLEHFYLQNGDSCLSFLVPFPQHSIFLLLLLYHSLVLVINSGGLSHFQKPARLSRRLSGNAVNWYDVLLWFMGNNVLVQYFMNAEFGLLDGFFPGYLRHLLLFIPYVVYVGVGLQ